MNKRVVFSRRRFHDPVAGLPFEELGDLEEGRWGLLPDEALLAAASRGRKLPLLYFSPEDCTHAVRKLDPPAVSGVIRKRLGFWSPQALDQGMDLVYRSERQCLVLSALAAAADTAQVQFWFKHLESSLELLAHITGAGRYLALKPVDMLILLLRGEARLIEENRAMEGTGWSGNDSVLRELAKKSVQAGRNRASALCAAIAGLGRSEFGGALPFIEVERVFSIRPFDGDLASALEARDVPFTECLDGLVAVWPLRSTERLTDKGGAARVVYFSRGEFIEDLNDLTPEQMARDVQQKLDEGYEASCPAFLEFLHELALEQALLRRNVLSVVDPGTALEIQLREQVLEETKDLRTRLAQTPPWFNRDRIQAAEAVALLRSIHQKVERDAALLEELARHARRAGLSSRFAYIRQFKKRNAVPPA